LVLRQSRKDVFLYGKNACTNAVAALPQRKNGEIDYFEKLQYPMFFDYPIFSDVYSN
jgi:hypothetical protein